MQSDQSHSLLDDLIIQQAVRRAQQSGWVVVPDHCFIYALASDNEALFTGQARAWVVYMSVQRFYNPSLPTPRRLECRIELLGDCLCAV